MHREGGTDNSPARNEPADAVACRSHARARRSRPRALVAPRLATPAAPGSSLARRASRAAPARLAPSARRAPPARRARRAWPRPPRLARPHGSAAGPPVGFGAALARVCSDG